MGAGIIQLGNDKIFMGSPITIYPGLRRKIYAVCPVQGIVPENQGGLRSSMPTSAGKHAPLAVEM
jgi:hypothetical protein